MVKTLKTFLKNIFELIRYNTTAKYCLNMPVELKQHLSLPTLQLAENFLGYLDTQYNKYLKYIRGL